MLVKLSQGHFRLKIQRNVNGKSKLNGHQCVMTHHRDQPEALTISNPASVGLSFIVDHRKKFSSRYLRRRGPYCTRLYLPHGLRKCYLLSALE